MMMAMIGMTAPLLLLAAQAVLHLVVQVVLHLAAQAALHLAALVVVLEDPQEAHRAVAHPRVPLVDLALVAPVDPLAVVPVVVRPVVDLVVDLPVEDPKAVHQVEVRKAALLSERDHLDDYKRIQMPSPASTIPIISSNLRAFSSSLVSKGVPEIIRATNTYQPPSMHIAMKATKARSPQVKSG